MTILPNHKSLFLASSFGHQISHYGRLFAYVQLCTSKALSRKRLSAFTSYSDKSIIALIFPNGQTE